MTAKLLKVLERKEWVHCENIDKFEIGTLCKVLIGKNVCIVEDIDREQMDALWNTGMIIKWVHYETNTASTFLGEMMASLITWIFI